MDNVLLGYIPRKSLSSESPKTPSKSFDVDFHDVFGGPPRRSSTQDWRSSLGSGEEEAGSGRDPWSGLSDRPVFGEESSSSRKKYHSNDFFDDIFRGDESSSSTPRKLSRDPLSSSSSPARSLSFQSESFHGSSLLLPPSLSLPAKQAKEMDSSAFPAQNRNPRKNKETALISFPSSPGASTSRFSIEVNQRQEGFKNDARSSYRQSSLSKEVSLNSEGSSQAAKSDKHESEEDSTRSEVTYNSTQFHFSIYKWATTVVPVAMPLREGKISSSKDIIKKENTVNEDAASDLLGVKLPSNNHDALADNELYLGGQKNQDDNSVLTIKSDLIGSPKIAEEVVPTKPLSSFQNIFRKVQGSLQSQNVGKNIKAVSGVDLGSLGASEKRMPVSKKEVPKPEEPLYCLLDENKHGSSAGTDNDSIGHTKKKMPISKTELSKPEESLCSQLKENKNDSDTFGADKELMGNTAKLVSISKKEETKPEESLYCLLKDDSKTQGSGKATDKSNVKKSTVKSINTSSSDVQKDKKAKKQRGKRNVLNPAKATSSILLDAPANLEDNPVNNKVKGKVKDFVKIFNQEVPELLSVETRDQGNTVADIGAGRPEDQASLGATKADKKKNSTLTDMPVTVDRSSEQYTKHQREIKTAEQIFGFAFERNKSPTSFSETVTENFGNVEESCEDFDCTVKELSQDQNNQLQAGQNNEDVQASDAKIKKWSTGKEGNIRSLLSTLQYVLWAESGWKPVPLVDIIEGSSVRRAYQKALLCLHPDKLQQKGAAPHQKYIAEKVFDILQDAWTHFNSLGSV